MLFLHVHEPHTEFNASIAALAGVAKHLGAQHEVLGIPAGAPVAPVLEEIRKRRADIVAASLFTRYLPGFRALFSGLASNTDALKIVGGPHPTVRPGDMLRWEGMDAIVLGEGERPLAHILRELAAGRSLKTRPGLWVRDADGFHGDPPTADAEPFIGDNPQ